MSCKYELCGGNLRRSRGKMFCTFVRGGGEFIIIIGGGGGFSMNFFGGGRFGQEQPLI